MKNGIHKQINKSIVFLLALIVMLNYLYLQIEFIRHNGYIRDWYYLGMLYLGLVFLVPTIVSFVLDKEKIRKKEYLKINLLYIFSYELILAIIFTIFNDRYLFQELIGYFLLVCLALAITFFAQYFIQLKSHYKSEVEFSTYLITNASLLSKEKINMWLSLYGGIVSFGVLILIIENIVGLQNPVNALLLMLTGGCLIATALNAKKFKSNNWDLLLATIMYHTIVILFILIVQGRTTTANSVSLISAYIIITIAISFVFLWIGVFFFIESDKKKSDYFFLIINSFFTLSVLVYNPGIYRNTYQFDVMDDGLFIIEYLVIVIIMIYLFYHLGKKATSEDFI